MKISIGNDHAGTEYKNAIVKHLESKGYTLHNYGTNTIGLEATFGALTVGRLGCCPRVSL